MYIILTKNHNINHNQNHNINLINLIILILQFRNIKDNCKILDNNKVSNLCSYEYIYIYIYAYISSKIDSKFIKFFKNSMFRNK